MTPAGLMIQIRVADATSGFTDARITQATDPRNSAIVFIAYFHAGESSSLVRSWN